MTKTLPNEARVGAVDNTVENTSPRQLGYTELCST